MHGVDVQMYVISVATSVRHFLGLEYRRMSRHI